MVLILVIVLGIVENYVNYGKFGVNWSYINQFLDKILIYIACAIPANSPSLVWVNVALY